MAPLEDVYRDILETVTVPGSSFILSDLTLSLFKENWYSFISDRKQFIDGVSYENKEKELLCSAREKWDGLLRSYEQPQIDQAKIDAMMAVYHRASEKIDEFAHKR